VIAMGRGINKYCIWVAAAMLICQCAVRAQSPTARVTTLNLRDYGWQAPDPLLTHETDTVDRRSIVIDHLGRVLVGFAVRERSGLVTREQPAFALHIVRLSPDSKPDLSLSLPANGWRDSSIYLSDTDQLIVRANDKIQLFQPDSGNALKDSWKTLTPCPFRCRVKQSPTGRTLFVYAEDADPPLTIIHASQIPKVERCGLAPHSIESIEDKIQNFPQSITDEFACFSGQTPQLEAFTYRWPFCDYKDRVRMPSLMVGRCTALSNNSFITGTNGELEVISSDGQVRFRQHMAKHESWDNFWAPVRSSESGDLIAVDLLTTRGENRTLDISGHVTARRIAVYDIGTGREIASIPVNHSHRYRFEFDLSPDGRHLAILEDAALRIVELTAEVRSPF
jgi:hypothetical protein